MPVNYLGNVLEERSKAQGEPSEAINATLVADFQKDGSGEAGGLVTAVATIPELNIKFEIQVTGQFPTETITSKGKFSYWETTDFAGDGFVAWLNMDSLISKKGENQIFFYTIVDNKYKVVAFFTGGEAPDPSWQYMGMVQWTKSEE